MATSLRLPVLDHHQQAVQVVADVLLRHGVLHQRRAAGAGPSARSAKRGRLARRLGQARKILGRQRLQREAALARLDQQPLVLLLQRDLGVVGQRAQDVEQLARPDGDRRAPRRPPSSALRAVIWISMSVARNDKRVRGALDQHVGQDRQRMAPLDDAAHRRKRSEELVALCFDQNHCSLPLS